MEPIYRKATQQDAELLIRIYNAAFYDDHIRFHCCPEYGYTHEQMARSIHESEKHLIYLAEKPVGAFSISRQRKGIYHISCLCVIPAYQGQNIGTKTVQFIQQHYTDWEKFSLITPAEKQDNVNFYTKKCSFAITGEETDEKTKLYRFTLRRKTAFSPLS